MANTDTIRFMSYPRTEPPPRFVEEIVAVFRQQAAQIETEPREKHLQSDKVLAAIRSDLEGLGFEVERGKRTDQKVARPVFFGEGGVPTLRFEVDAFHPTWECGLEVEATRAIRGGAFYRDMIQALVMAKVSHLCIAVPNIIRYGKGNKSRDFEEAVRVADALFGHSRIQFPYGLTLIGY